MKRQLHAAAGRASPWSSDAEVNSLSADALRAAGKKQRAGNSQPRQLSFADEKGGALEEHAPPTEHGASAVEVITQSLDDGEWQEFAAGACDLLGLRLGAANMGRRALVMQLKPRFLQKMTLSVRS